MKCFNHPDIDAVALCKSCSRALCRECMAEVGLSCSCRNRCEKDVATLNELVERARTVYGKSSATYFRTGLFTLLIGAVFILLGLSSFLSDHSSPSSYFLLVMGLIFAGWGISYFVSAKRMNQK